VILGSAPLLDADTALTALDAAVQAYDKGRGAWPTCAWPSVSSMSKPSWRACANSAGGGQAADVGDRQEPQGLEKEFDRTCDYIVDTINALKDLDRRSSRFELEQGTLGQIRRAPLGVALCMGPTTTR
jgi:glyceraldehyde-3-phosphate dehydrogenase (NADP+)